MYSLFSNKPSESGYRLHRYEIWNWGTFDRDVYTLEPGGETSLLIGANASGKTTLVDGLLTLLVPERRMRFYNQTAGAKGERSEESYVLGEYGEAENAETKAREIKRLRQDKQQAQSVLLAVFQNEASFVTLAQVRWFAGGELKRTFILAHKDLSIVKDFSSLDSNGEWKKRLKQAYAKQSAKALIHLTDSPGEYGRLMRKTFGMLSEKAHTLFSQTIGLKVLGNLDEFVRMQMLEEKDAEGEFQKIKDYFKTLNDAHLAIVKAHRQIELLAPIRDKHVLLSTLKADQLQQETYQSALPLWFALKQKQLVADYIQQKQQERADTEAVIQQQEDAEAALSETERELDIQIRNDEVGKRIADLESQNRNLTIEKKSRERELQRYNALAAALDLQQSPDTVALFEDQRQEAVGKREKLNEHLQHCKNKEFEAQTRHNSLQLQFDGVTDELKQLRSQKNNITGRTAAIRKDLLQALGLTAEELPFFGELIKVKEEAKSWEPAIERLLRHFALQIGVPEPYYEQVNAYVQQHNLQGRIAYQKVNSKPSAPPLFQQAGEKELIHKLAFKEGNYTEWLINEIKANFGFICTEDMTEWSLCEKAVTKTGLIKQGNRHEKDDRPERLSRAHYVLGWDNKEKIARLQDQAAELQESITQTNHQVTHFKNQQQKATNNVADLNRLIDIQEFEKLNWWEIAEKIQANAASISDLKQRNDKVKALKEQQQDVLGRLKKVRDHLQGLRNTLHTLSLDLDEKQRKLQEAESTISHYAGTANAEHLSRFEQVFVKEPIVDLATLAALQYDVRGTIQKQLDNLKNAIRKEESAAEGLMRKFKTPDTVIAAMFPDWHVDTHRLSENVEFIEDYISLLARIESQELVQYKKQFKKYLDEEMITMMSDLQVWLYKQEDEIKEKIDVLNSSLHQINFKNNPPTFIKLQAEEDHSPHVRDFKLRLKTWQPNMAEYQRTQDDTILEESFNKIKSLLDDLTASESIRKEVMDVRNWFKFKAVEYYREDPDKLFRSYTGTAKLSGGEGSQLTYTILSSAIAYQFGIHSDGLNPNSFRFICVDEAFSKQDDEKARFLMELCKQLHLQLIVVSPAKAEEVAIVEPYIARVHFVQRKHNRNSVVYDMPIKQLQEHRQVYFESLN
ncbi:ATP-binding protein [Pontibacter virosus]|uniref:Uncharacterized protein YPO0396 n=1 Tax=Pontibacter virosus TaxID=1765052 RepID=A0A2U1AWU3_9BACT|nr:SbcC/MukB-like Walker B domain-containing protein [Pontibacter virosus]PVY40878.1 uncharacterized protein YPO0396 [Pontibacter virosus]